MGRAALFWRALFLHRGSGLIAPDDGSSRWRAHQEAEALIGLISALGKIAVEAQSAGAIKQKAITCGIGQKLFGLSLLRVDHNPGVGKFTGTFQKQRLGLLLVKDYIGRDEIRIHQTAKLVQLIGCLWLLRLNEEDHRWSCQVAHELRGLWPLRGTFELAGA